MPLELHKTGIEVDAGSPACPDNSVGHKFKRIEMAWKMDGPKGATVRIGLSGPEWIFVRFRGVGSLNRPMDPLAKPSI